MADEPQKVNVQASRIDASILPPGFSLAYKLYVIQQTTDLKNVADASNGASEQAYQATLKNNEQDKRLDDQEGRISTLKITVDNHEVRITAAEGSIVTILSRLATTDGNISSLGVRVSATESSITALQGDYVSKTATAPQSLASPLNVSTSYSVGGIKVIGARQTGWTASVGSGYLGGLNVDQNYPAGSTYSQSEVQTIGQGLLFARQRIKALEDAMRAHGLID